MTGRLKLLAAALGLVFATGTIAEVSAQAVTTPTTQAQTTQTKTTQAASTPAKATPMKTVPTKVAKGHRAMKIARNAHRVHLAKSHRHLVRHLASHRHLKPVAKATIGTKTIKQASLVHRERHAMNRRGTTKAISVIR